MDCFQVGPGLPPKRPYRLNARSLGHFQGSAAHNAFQGVVFNGGRARDCGYCLDNAVQREHGRCLEPSAGLEPRAKLLRTRFRASDGLTANFHAAERQHPSAAARLPYVSGRNGISGLSFKLFFL
jgi:hypothetical protein